MRYFFWICFFCLFSLNSNANEKITVLLDWFANPDHAPLFIAKEKGFFKDENLDVDLIGPADASDPPKLVAAGKVDLGITYQPQFLEQVDNGLPVKIIGILVNHPLNCLVVKKNSGIETLQDLKNKRIGYSGGDLSNLTLKVMFENQGISSKSIQLINIHYALTQALLTNRVDAVTGMMRNFETIQMELAGHPAKIFLPENYGIPNYNELVFVVNKNNTKNPKFLKFFKALKKAVIYLHNHPEETWLLFAKNHPELNNDLNHKAWFETIPYFAVDPGSINLSEFVYFAKFMHENGLIKTIQPISNYLNLKEK